MDLGIRGKTALVCAASKGLGKACAVSLAREGVDLTITARSAEALEAAAEEIRRATDVKVKTAVGDIATDVGRTAALRACPEPDILVTNAGGPRGGDFRDWSHEEWIAALETNMLAPIFLMRATLDSMIRKRFGRIVNITSHAVKAPLATLGMSNGARMGLTGFVAGLSRQTVRHNVTINNLLPGLHDTDRKHSAMEAIARQQGVTVESAIERYVSALPAARIGNPAEFGDACAFLCSAQAGYITGINLSVDGGAYPGTMG
jgi:3-oxoacyl-[acyl-carrier protein] reductase